jgi:hypothetical protein
MKKHETSKYYRMDEIVDLLETIEKGGGGDVYINLNKAILSLAKELMILRDTWVVDHGS